MSGTRDVLQHVYTSANVDVSISCKSQSAQEWKMSSRVFGLIGDEASKRDAESMSYVLGLGQQGNTM